MTGKNGRLAVRCIICGDCVELNAHEEPEAILGKTISKVCDSCKETMAWVKELRVKPKSLYDRWVDTLKCPECGSKELEVHTVEENRIGYDTGMVFVERIYCKSCELTYGKNEPVDFINNERKRIYEKWRGKIKLSDFEMREIGK